MSGHRSGAVDGSAFHSRCRCWATKLVVAAAFCLALLCPAIAAQPSPDRPRVPVIEAGTPVDDSARDRWNRIVLLATPRFVSGDVGDVSEAIKESVSAFTFCVLATVRPASDGEAAKQQLIEVGIGYSMLVDGCLTLVAPDAKLPGMALDFLGRQILGAKHKSLGDITCIGKHNTAIVFDVPTLMVRGDDHEDLVVRHFVRVDPRTGTCSTCAWLLGENGDDMLTPLDDPLRLVVGGTREERLIHVDGRRFTFGFPTKQAFGVEDLPPGSRIAWSPALRTVADAPSYSEESIDQLGAALDAAVISQRILRSASGDDETTE